MINALQNSIDQGKELDLVDLTANGDYTSTYLSNKKLRPFLLDLPSAGDMKVQFKSGKIGIFSFREGTSPVVQIVKVFDTGSSVKTFQVIYQ